LPPRPRHNGGMKTKNADMLSQDEIDRLLSVISSGQAAAEPVAARGENKRIKIYDFKRPDKLSKDQIRILSNIHEIFARLTTTSLSARLQSLAQIHVASVDQLTFEEFTRSIPNPTVLAVVQMDPLKGSAILEMDPAVSFSIIDRLFGGKGAAGRLTRELTDIEQSAIEGILVRTLGNLREAWTSVVDLRPRLEQIESNPQFAQIIPQSEMVILVTMEIKVGGVEGMMNLCIPCLTIDPIVGKLSSQFLYSSVRRGATTENIGALANGLSGIELNVVAEVGKAGVTLRDVLGLRCGDVIRLQDARSGDALVLRIGDRRKFSYRPGVVGGRIAAQISKRLETMDRMELAELAAAE
jgi:flagellar motor switch protein FliM